MSDFSARLRDGGCDDRPPTRRALAKLQTRDRVLQAAKRLFVARGYEAATIRDIAVEAGMSTGAVFANFTDKNHLFREVLHADAVAHMDQAAGLADHAGPIDEGLLALFSQGYANQLSQLPLLQAATSLSWEQGMEGDYGERPQAKRAIDLVDSMLQAAIARKELAKGASTRFLAEMLWDVYTANYRRAVFDGWTHEALDERMAQQIKVVLAGARV